MITDVLMQIAIIKTEVPNDEFDADIALETAIENVGRDVTESERQELDEMLPQWVESEVEQ